MHFRKFLDLFVADSQSEQAILDDCGFSRRLNWLWLAICRSDAPRSLIKSVVIDFAVEKNFAVLYETRFDVELEQASSERILSLRFVRSKEEAGERYVSVLIDFAYTVPYETQHLNKADMSLNVVVENPQTGMYRLQDWSNNSQNGNASRLYESVC